jgi:hypothetical protein
MLQVADSPSIPTSKRAVGGVKLRVTAPQRFEERTSQQQIAFYLSQ